MRKNRPFALISQGTSSHQPLGGIPDAEFRVSTRVSGFDKWLLRQLMAAIGDPAIAVELWNGEVFTFGGGEPAGKLIIRNRVAIYHLLRNTELYFGDLYCTRGVEVKGDLPGFLHTVYRSIGSRDKTRLAKILKLFNTYRPHINTLSTSRRNIHHHYDIGNEFYRQWLDREAMQYTCAYFPEPEMSLEQAQIAKMHHVCRKLRLKAGQSVVEAGCGWGGLALFMAREYGVKVKAYNISREQIAFARQRVAEAGMAGQVEYIEDDCRNITGEHDVFVSIGMLEHIGIHNYRALGELIDRVLKRDGVGLIHTIGRNRPGLLNAWIEKRIFPGACPPSISQMMEIFEPQAFSVLDIENLRLHYARTLEHWLARFEENCEEYREQYDESFVRAWRLYLAGSIAAFTSGTTQLFQVLFSRSDNNDLPSSRAHLYKA